MNIKHRGKLKTKMDFKNCYISSNCNQTPTSADCNKNNIIAYGACNSVLIYDPQFGSGGKITHTLIGHTKRVNSVRWIRGQSCQYDGELISGSTDGTVIVWILKEEKYVPTYLRDKKFPNILSVNIVDGYYDGDKTVVCSAAMNQYTLRIWHRLGNSDFDLSQSCLFGSMNNPRLCVGLRIGHFQQCNKLIIACALDNSKIEVMMKGDNSLDQDFIICETLTGHDDWVRGLDFTTDENGDLLLASCSQDSSIRLWRIKNIDNTENTKKDNNPKIYLESVLPGHEGWVYSVNWSPTSMQLLSASIDKSMIIWELDEVSGLWLEKIRVGEVGGNTLGFYGGFFNPNGKEIVAYSYHGAFHIWTKNENNLWDPSVTIGGHFGEVVDLAWEPQGEFLYSISADQTTRIHAPWRNNFKEVTWHEIARPQVHGYDLSSIAVISRYKYASGAEEKLIRTFEAPQIFVDNFKRICQITEQNGEIIEKDSSSYLPKGASVPSLGLSNKAVYTEDNIGDTISMDNKNPYPEESHFTAQILREPPTEETLLQNTLWPEIQKLYGHGYEIFTLAASPDGKYLASACKSTKPQHAGVFIWDTSNWQQIQNLLSHNLTIVQMQFSPDSKHLLSVSRDRRWSLFSKNNDSKFELVATTNKETSVHARIIWTCAWTHDSKYFATGSRDGKLVLWTENKKKEPTVPLGHIEKATKPLEFSNESVTAVAFAPHFVSDAYLCAVGFEKGIIEIFRINNLTFRPVLSLSTSDAHHLTVRRLSFRPKFGQAGSTKENNNILQLASCSSDMSVRIYDLILSYYEKCITRA